VTAAEQETLGKYVRLIADRIGLRDWSLEVRPEPPNEVSALATCEPVFGRKLAVLRVCDRFRSLTAAEQREIVVHELLHCHLAAAADAVRLDLPHVVPDHTFQVFWSSYERAVEYAVDGLTAAVAPHLPLISWSGGKKGG
jgi:hypothetical protein